MNSRIPSTPPVIAPVAETAIRPLWSVVIPAYNCIEWLQQTMESVLAQDPGPEKMQIEVIDDCSTDGDVAALVQAVGKGRIGYYRQEKNVGHLRNFETCLNRTRGHYVHLFHGDDIVLKGFYTTMEELFDKYPQAGAAFTQYATINHKNKISPPGPALQKESGIIKDFLLQIATKQLLQVAAMVVKRSVYEHLGSFYAVRFAEDWEMWIRIAAHYPVAYTPECLALYRGGQDNAGSITSTSMVTGENLYDIKKVINLAQNYLPIERRKELGKKAMNHFSRHYAKASNRIYFNSPKVAFVQANTALRIAPNIKTAYWVMKLYMLHVGKIISKPVNIINNKYGRRKITLGVGDR